MQSEVTGGTAVAADGSTYLAGFTTSFEPSGNPAVFLIKFAPNGSLSWQRTWEGPETFGNDEATDVAVAADGSVYVTGTTVGQGGDVLLLKFSSDGSLEWQKRWGGPGFDGGEAVAVGTDSSVYVAGGTTGADGSSNLLVLKVAPGGTLVWQKMWGPGRGDGIATGPDGNVYVAGGAPRPNSSFGHDVVLLKVDPAGALLWERAYSPPAEVADSRGGVAVAPDGSAYVAGAIQDSQRKVVVDALLVKFSADGSLVWDRRWGGRSGDVSGAVAAAADGTVLWAGDSNSYGAGSDDAFLLRLSPDGRSLDSSTWGGTGIDHGDGVEEAPDGTMLLGATTETSSHSLLDAPMKTSRLRGTAATPTTALADASGTLVDAGGTVGTPGGTTPGAGGFDAALVRILS